MNTSNVIKLIIGLMLLLSCQTIFGMTCPQALAKADKYNETLSSFSEKLNSSENIIFMNGEKNIEKIEASEFQPGNTYTVVIYKGYLILGKNIPGEDGSFGSSRSHINLLVYAGAERVGMRSYLGNGGAIRINSDKSISISGYHTEKKDPEAANRIGDALTAIYSSVKLHLTGDRLSTLSIE